ncbi:GntR family transcriptional regulator [Paenibacillus sp. strain BS8-2]
MNTVTLKDKAYTELKQLLLDGDISSSEQLTEKHLVEQLQMSRTPVRSALDRLAAEGLLACTPNRGYSIPELSLQKVSDYFDYRIALESHIVYKLANRSLSPQEESSLRSNLEQQLDAVAKKDYSSFTKCDLAFHQLLAQIYDNAEMLAMVENLQDRLYQIGLKVLRRDHTRIETSYEDHRQLLELILAEDGEAARALMVKHLEYGARILIV